MNTGTSQRKAQQKATNTEAYEREARRRRQPQLIPASTYHNLGDMSSCIPMELPARHSPSSTQMHEQLTHARHLSTLGSGPVRLSEFCKIRSTGRSCGADTSSLTSPPYTSNRVNKSQKLSPHATSSLHANSRRCTSAPSPVPALSSASLSPPSSHP